jgi:Protein of unknown function (DUF3822)
MEKLNLEITDRRFSNTAASEYELSLLVGTDGLSYLAADGNKEVLALKSWRFLNPENRFREVESAIRNIFVGDEKLGLTFAKSHVAVYNNLTTLVPNRLFNPTDLPSYFSLLLRPDAALSYHYDDLPEMDAKLVFAVDSEVSRLCGQYFPKGDIFHSSTALLSVWQKMSKRNGFDVFVNLRNQIAQIAVFDRRNLLFYNSFSFAKASDFLYFVLLAFDQMRLNPQETPLTVCGELLEDSEIYKLLFRYVKEVNFVSVPGGYYQFPGAIQAIPSHLNFDLYALRGF